MVLALATLAPKIIIPSFFIAHKVRGEKDVNVIINTIAFTVMFAATIVILFQDSMPWIALITCMSAVLFYQRSEGVAAQTTLIYALSIAIMSLTFYGYGASPLSIIGVVIYIGSYFAKPQYVFTFTHILGLLAFSYGVHDPGFLKELGAICEHLA